MAHEVAKKEEVVRNDDGKIVEVRADEHVSADSDLAVQVPDEVHRDAEDFENTRSAPSPAEAAKNASKPKASSKKSD
jgi:hypothetical protein